MMTFLEYIQSSPRRHFPPSDKEVELLYKCRDKLGSSPFGDKLIDFSGKLESPYLWIALPPDLGGGLRIYVINGEVAIRLQAGPRVPAIGKAYRVPGRRDHEEINSLSDPDEKMRKRDPKKDPDFTMADRLLGEIHRVMEELRAVKRKRVQALNQIPRTDVIPFRPFWPEPPDAAPLY